MSRNHVSGIPIVTVNYFGCLGQQNDKALMANVFVQNENWQAYPILSSLTRLNLIFFARQKIPENKLGISPRSSK